MKKLLSQYKASKMLEKVLAHQLELQEKDSAHLLKLLQAECPHENKFYEDIYDYLKRKESVACHCKDCGKYLGRKHC